MATVPARATAAVLDHDVREGAVDGIVTPEAVVLDLETAGVASRVLAGAIDLLIQLGIFLVALFLIGLLAIASSFDDDSISFLNTLYAVLTALILMGYPVIFEVWMRGRTPGKRAVGLRAVTIEGAPIRLRHAMLRMMGGLVDRYLVPVGVVGSLFVLATRRGQRVGDLLAGTIVVRDPDRTPLPPAVWFPVPPGYEQYAATIDPTAITVQQYTVVRTFLMRNRELDASARYSVASDLAERVARTVGCTYEPSRVHPETFLLCAIARYQRRTYPEYQPTSWQR